MKTQPTNKDLFKAVFTIVGAFAVLLFCMCGESVIDWLLKVFNL